MNEIQQILLTSIISVEELNTMLYGVIDIEKEQFPAIGDSLTRLNIFKGTAIQTKTNSPWTALKYEMLNSLFFYH